MKNWSKSLLFISVALLISFCPQISSASREDILTKEEVFWLKSRNNTLIVYPEKNFPPFSYQDSAGNPQGLSIDYLKLIADKIGVKIGYLQARPLSQILDDIKQGKGDIVTSLTFTDERGSFLYFTDSYVSVPAVIVVRKDSKFNFKSINDLVGKKVGIGDQYAVAEYIRKNNPRIIIEPMSDDETSLQQLVLGEIDASVMDVASLSHYLSKQVLSSVKIVGNTGFEYKLAFAVTKDKEILQSILDKGLQQISTADRNVITEKWITFQNEAGKNSVFLDYLKNNTSTLILYVLIIVVIILLIKKRKKHFSFHRRRKINAVNELKEEMLELEETSKDLKSELEGIEVLEEDIKEKIRKIGE